jgi:hypothetical protein
MALLVQVGMMATSKVALPLLLLLPPAQVPPYTQIPALSLVQASVVCKSAGHQYFYNHHSSTE